MAEPDILSELNRQSRELKTIREMLAKVINYMVEAESEVSEKMRRFIMYMHDLHDVTYMYEERGHQAPPWIIEEMKRCDDRYRQLLQEAHAAGGTFEKVRREMASDPTNRWDHTMLLPKQLRKDEGDETGSS